MAFADGCRRRLWARCVRARALSGLLEYAQDPDRLKSISSTNVLLFHQLIRRAGDIKQLPLSESRLADGRGVGGKYFQRIVTLFGADSHGQAGLAIIFGPDGRNQHSSWRTDDDRGVCDLQNAGHFRPIFSRRNELVFYRGDSAVIFGRRFGGNDHRGDHHPVLVWPAAGYPFGNGWA